MLMEDARFRHHQEASGWAPEKTYKMTCRDWDYLRIPISARHKIKEGHQAFLLLPRRWASCKHSPASSAERLSTWANPRRHAGAEGLETL